MDDPVVEEDLLNTMKADFGATYTPEFVGSTRCLEGFGELVAEYSTLRRRHRHRGL